MGPGISPGPRLLFSTNMNMRAIGKVATLQTLACAGLSLALCVSAQDLTPRAYVISPVGSNAFLVTYGHNSGDVLLDPTIPIKDLNGQFSTPVLGFYRSFDLLGRSANVAIGAPYLLGHFSGTVAGQTGEVRRS